MIQDTLRSTDATNKVANASGSHVTPLLSSPSQQKRPEVKLVVRAKARLTTRAVQLFICVRNLSDS